ncbi:cytochrome c biogenesis protein CcdA [Leptodesmis sichuanensis]|uniref:cytochrome c biogenesis protein CcdA n=1 Tax=Leptodesmis sichuanensis TaxID=2906798 RepID=UPI001F2910A9|nr:cytochrome c biogenesis protein CcdA [Leptodesmis sichuanensis]UIE38335.1 sulfite exporter TauE/SafE family protein [Leptodesmis sichuanensis A121]
MTRVKSLHKTLTSRHLRKLLWLPGLFLGGWLFVWLTDRLMQSPFYRQVEQFAFWIGENYDRWLSQQTVNNPLLLIGFAFVGGLVASVSPCILSLLPVNLSYIGTREITSRRDAFSKASAFVLGVVTVLSLLGLFSSLASFVLVRYRGYFFILVGTVIVLMSLQMAGILQFSMPQISLPTTQPDPAAGKPTAIATRRSISQSIRSLLTGPYGIGLTFALVSSPCSSPIMVSILAVAAATGSQLQSTVTMVSYALGYSAVIFLASLFTGLAKQTRWLLVHSDTITRVASVVLLIIGLVYLMNGGYWVLSTLS